MHFVNKFFAIVLGTVLCGCSSSGPSAQVTGTIPRGFLETSANINPSWRLYTVAEHRLVGHVKTVEKDHVFPDNTTRDAVLVVFTDKTEQWIPLDAVKKLYVTRAS
jgi:hypothetical protein